MAVQRTVKIAAIRMGPGLSRDKVYRKVAVSFTVSNLIQVELLLEARFLFLWSSFEGRRHEELSFLEIELPDCLNRDGL